MNAVAAIMAVFSAIGALDRVLGGRLGLGKEFEKGFMMFGPLALSMIGMIVIAPLMAQLLQHGLNAMHAAVGIDPSLIMGMLFANDMGGASLATGVAADAQLGRFNGLVVSAMMGCTISFTIPFALEKVGRQQREGLLLGLLCGIVTIPVGCFAAGLMMGVPVGALALDMLPLTAFSLLIAAGLWLAPGACARVFGWLGTGIKALITLGLLLSIIRYLIGWEIVPGLATLDEGAAICLNASVVMTGAFPLLAIVSRLLRHPLEALGRRMGINSVSATGFVSSLAASITTFEMMDRMDAKGVMLNAAFSVSAAFVFADHLAFTLAFDPAYLPGVVAGKLISGVLAVVVASAFYTVLSRRRAGRTVSADK